MENEDVSNEWSDEEKFEFYKLYAEVVLKKNYGDNYELYQDGDTITIKIWKEGIAQGAILARNGNTELLDSWDTMVNNTKEFATTRYEELETVNATDKHVMVNIMNDENLDNVLVTYMDGVVVYDAVHAQ